MTTLPLNVLRNFTDIDGSPGSSRVEIEVETPSGIERATSFLFDTQIELIGMDQCPLGQPICDDVTLPFTLIGSRFFIDGREIEQLRLDTQRGVVWALFFDSVLLIEGIGDQGRLTFEVDDQPSESLIEFSQDFDVLFDRASRRWSGSTVVQGEVAGFTGTLRINLGGTIGNHPPFANAGANSTLDCQPGGTPLTLGDHSSDLDGPNDITARFWGELILNPAAPPFETDPDLFDVGVLDPEVPLYFVETLGEGTSVQATARGGGQHEFFVTVLDSAGNVSYDNVFVTLVDNQPPRFVSLVPNIHVRSTVLSGATVQIPPLEAFDDCDDSPIRVGGVPPTQFPLGTTSLSFNAEDSVGNVATLSTTVTVDGVLDFDTDGQTTTLPSGLAVARQWSSFGVTISCNNANDSHPDACLLYSTSDVTGDDFDLGAPNEKFGGPGVGTGGETGNGINDMPLGNVLIIAENLVDSDGDGLVDDPDDEAAGGTIRVSFDTPTTVLAALVMDIDLNEPTVQFRLTRADASVERVGVPARGDNSVQLVTIGIDDVVTLELDLDASGALAELVYRPTR